MKHFSIVIIFVLLFFTLLFAGTTGKIAGTITDVETGETLPGVNVIIEGTSFGAVTNLEGYYVILNVPPGTYVLKAKMVGYAEQRIQDVKVNIDLTTPLNIKLKPQVLEGETVTVVAPRPVVQKDVAASQMQVTSEQIKNLPVASVTEAIGLQVGVTSDLGIRGSDATQSLFLVDGISLRDERDNKPVSKVPLSAVKQVSVQAGGFGAEYNNVRSGLVNVVTRDGDADRYSGSFNVRYRPAGPKYFGKLSPYDRNSYWLRPYFDDAVCWTGTKNGAWDIYTQRQYPEFSGWNAVSEASLKDDNPNNDVTPTAAQRIFEWEHRKQGDIKKPDYLYDFGFGGPVPFIGKKLGNLRFFASARREREMYLIRLSREALVDQTAMLKMASDITPNMKLSMLGMYGETYAVSNDFSGGTSYMTTTYDVASEMSTGSFTTPTRIYTDIYYSPTANYYTTFSGKLTHMLNPKTYYEAQVKFQRKKYYTNPNRYRDEETLYEIFPGYYLDERPQGFSEDPIFGIDGIFIMGGPVSVSRDHSKHHNISAKFDLVSQVNSRNQIKTGVEVVFDNFDMSFGQYNAYLPEGNTWTTIKQKPIRGNFYLQDKLEFEGFISIVGVVVDMYTPNSNWYNVDAYDRVFFGQGYDPELEAAYKTKKVKPRWTVSPRLSVSHPITANSKLYFNYGHYRQMPTSERLYRVQRSSIDAINYIGDPTIPQARTVSYELGYDHALFNNYLLRLSAYYKDITDQEYWVRYISFDSKVNYRRITNNSYEDIRGFELDFSKNFGRWIVGDINYEYRVQSSGHFGWAYQYEDPSEQRKYQARNPEQTKPRPRPRVKAFIDLHSPNDFGPKIFGHHLFGDLHLNTIGRWTAGAWTTWNPNNIPGINYNVRWKDYYNVDVKFSKNFRFGAFDVKAFLDIYNVFNFKYFSDVSHVNVYDRNYYMFSLHLPETTAAALGYNNIPGNDRPGDYRKAGVKYQPMEWCSDVNEITAPNSRVIYYEGPTKRYMQYQDGEWMEVPDAKIKRILKTKAYIDMPNQTFFTFLNPREIFFGLTVTYNF